MTDNAARSTIQKTKVSPEEGRCIHSTYHILPCQRWLESRAVANLILTMPYHDSPSPARRPQLLERTSSNQSSNRGSPTTAAQNSKVSSQKSHKTHAAGGHHRHSHGRVSSHGKNLNKLSKLASVHPPDASPQLKGNGDVTSPLTSPTTSTTPIKQNSSNISLSRTGSKMSFKKNASNSSFKHNGSAAKLAQLGKSHHRPHPRNGSGQHTSSKAKAQFSVGSDDDDEEWVEASSSQSPITSRHSPNNSRNCQLEEPPSPDEPAGRTPPVLPHSPPQSPPNNGAEFLGREPVERGQVTSAPYSHPPDAEIVTHRLLNRHRPQNVALKTSNISATITPSGSNGSSSFNLHGGGLTPLSEPSMPADGVSRFLNATGSSSGSATPNSISHLQSTLANMQRNHSHLHHENPLHLSPLSSSSPGNGRLESSQRAKLAGHLAETRPLSGGENLPTFPSSPPVHNTSTRVSPFNKSNHNPREAGKSLTQLKLDLQRMSTNREPAHVPVALQPPLVMMHGAHAAAGLGGAATGERSAERRIRLWDQARMEFRNARRFHSMERMAMLRLERLRGGGEKRRNALHAEQQQQQRLKKENAAKLGPGGEEANGERGASSRPGSSRGRVRFEVGERVDNEVDKNEEDEGGGVAGLLKRMWEVNLEMGEGD